MRILVWLAFLSFSTANAQCYLMQTIPHGSYLGLRSNIPFFKSNVLNNTPRGLSGVHCLYGNLSMRNPKVHFQFEIPYIVANYSVSKEDGIGNIFLGLQRILTETSNLGFGVYLPTMNQYKLNLIDIGAISNFYRLPQYLQGATITLNFAFHQTASSGLIYGFEIGPDLAIPTGSSGGDAELLLHYAGKLGGKGTAVAGWIEVNGIFLLSASGDVNDRMLNQFNGCVQSVSGRFRPGLFYGIPLNSDFHKVLQGILGIKLEYYLN